MLSSITKHNFFYSSIEKNRVKNFVSQSGDSCISKISGRKYGSCLLWVMSTEILVDIAVDIAVDSRSI